MSDLKIEIWTDVPALSLLPEVRPRRVNRYTPNWWKDMPAGDFGAKTAKVCPGISDTFSTGIVIPAWSDTRFFRVDDDEWRWGWHSPSSNTVWGLHPRHQFIDHVPSWAGGKIDAVFKAINPWHIKTPVGYSVYQMPLFYQFNENFTPLPGIIDSDIYHTMHIPIAFHPSPDVDEVFIRRGEPLAMYFPFKRDSFEIEVREETEEDRLLMKKVEQLDGVFDNAYRNHRKQVDYDTY